MTTLPRGSNRTLRKWRRRLTWVPVLAFVGLSIQIPSRALGAPGDLDATFGTGGRVLTRLVAARAGVSTAVAIQPDGRIVLAGGGQEFAVARYRADGSLDPAFSGDGKPICSRASPSSRWPQTSPCSRTAGS